MRIEERVAWKVAGERGRMGTIRFDGSDPLDPGARRQGPVLPLALCVHGLGQVAHQVTPVEHDLVVGVTQVCTYRGGERFPHVYRHRLDPVELLSGHLQLDPPHLPRSPESQQVAVPLGVSTPQSPPLPARQAQAGRT